MTFGLGTVYELIQAYITHKMHPEINGRGVFVARLVIAILSACFFITCKFIYIYKLNKVV